MADTTAASGRWPRDVPDATGANPVGGPVWVAWREGTLTRVKELESLRAWVLQNHPRANSKALADAIPCHLEAAREAADPRKRFRLFGNASLIERAISNIDAAEAHLLNLAPPGYVLDQMPGLLNHVQRHLPANDSRRQEFERIAQELGGKDPAQTRKQTAAETAEELLGKEQGKIVSAWRGASSAALREQTRLRSFRNVLIVTTVAMTVLALGVAIIGYVSPTMVPLCFGPEESGQTVVVCPSGHSAPVNVGAGPGDLDRAVENAVGKGDLFIVEVIGLIAATVAAVAAIRRIRGSSEQPYGLPVALAVLKLPMGAITAFLGLLLMRGQFVPGLSALGPLGPWGFDGCLESL